MDIVAKEMKAQQDECSDGTATVAIFAEELLKDSFLLKESGHEICDPSGTVRADQ